MQEVGINLQSGYFKPEMPNVFNFYYHALPDVRLVRSANVHSAAGYLATIICSRLVYDDGWPGSDSLWADIGKGHVSGTHTLMSKQFALSPPCPGEGKDVDYAVHNAQVVWKTIKFLKDWERKVRDEVKRAA